MKLEVDEMRFRFTQKVCHYLRIQDPSKLPDGGDIIPPKIQESRLITDATNLRTANAGKDPDGLLDNLPKTFVRDNNHVPFFLRYLFFRLCFVILLFVTTDNRPYASATIQPLVNALTSLAGTACATCADVCKLIDTTAFAESFCNDENKNFQIRLVTNAINALRTLYTVEMASLESLESVMQRKMDVWSTGEALNNEREHAQQVLRESRYYTRTNAAAAAAAPAAKKKRIS